MLEGFYTFFLCKLPPSRNLHACQSLLFRAHHFQTDPPLLCYAASCLHKVNSTTRYITKDTRVNMTVLTKRRRDQNESWQRGKICIRRKGTGWYIHIHHFISHHWMTQNRRRKGHCQGQGWCQIWQGPLCPPGWGSSVAVSFPSLTLLVWGSCSKNSWSRWQALFNIHKMTLGPQQLWCNAMSGPQNTCAGVKWWVGRGGQRDILFFDSQV